jgi:UDP-N-acetylglucosamine 2-epimerase (non-hydrolysing)
MTVLGTRPEIIRLSLVIGMLDRFAEKHTLVHTGQNYDDRLNGLFFRELGIRQPDHFLGVKAESTGGQIGQILAGIEPLLIKHRPDRLLILGDTNSGLTAIIARRLGVPVYHMEAGNRCFDFRVPEEGNRRIIDHMSTVLMPYTNRSRENLLREGFRAESVIVTGNPIKEVIDKYESKIAASQILTTLGVTSQKYFVVTIHRAENVDLEVRLRNLVSAFEQLHASYGFPVLCSLHPRTRAKAAQFGIDLDRDGLKFLEPFGFFDFVHLEKHSFCLLSDSGTVQEEACIFGVPNVTVRDVTERPETLECGSNVLSGADPAMILKLVKMVTETSRNWKPPAEYLAPNVAATVCRILLGFSSETPV